MRRAPVRAAAAVPRAAGRAVPARLRAAAARRRPGVRVAVARRVCPCLSSLRCHPVSRAGRGYASTAVSTEGEGDALLFRHWRHQIGRAHVWNSSHQKISYAVFCLKKKKNRKKVDIKKKKGRSMTRNSYERHD